MASKIWDLAREAAAVRLQLAAVNATDWQLTPKAYYADALSVAGASEKEVARIEKAMSEPQHQAVLASAFRLTCKQIRDFKRSSAPRHVRHCIDAAADAALAKSALLANRLRQLAQNTWRRPPPSYSAR